MALTIADEDLPKMNLIDLTRILHKSFVQEALPICADDTQTAIVRLSH